MGKTTVDDIRETIESLDRRIDTLALTPKASPLLKRKALNGQTERLEAVASCAKVQCHGRVKDLESMVPAQWWKTVFADSMYLQTDGDCVEDPAITRKEVELLKNDSEIHSILSRKEDAIADSGYPVRILDLCCGQGRHSLVLASEFPHLAIHGHDQSKFLISLANKRAIEQSVQSRVVFTVGDCREIPYESDYFDLVLVMGNSFGYFANDDGDQVVLKEINRVLRQDGTVVLDLTDGDYMRENFAQRSWEWIDDKTFACRERQLSKDGMRLVSREVISDTSKGVIRDQFYQERLYSRQELESILVCNGLYSSFLEDGSSVNKITKELSQRNEDLGMMEQRMLIKGKKCNADSLVCTPCNSGPVLPFSNVCVVLGDPSIPCFGKLNDTWNKEDLETRETLVNALFGLGYKADQVSIMHSHSALFKSLASEKPAFVLNFCDEGFMNDALKELHVPAILETLGLSYSGAGPNCLAYCYDKGLVNRTADAIGVHVPRETLYLADINTPLVTDLDTIDKIIQDNIKYPAFVKPLKGDNSLGITARSIVFDKHQLNSYLQELEQIGIKNVVIQEYLQGTEYSVGVIGNTTTGFNFFPVLEVDYSNIIDRNLPPILGYESKWDPSSPYWSEIKYKQPNLAPATLDYLKSACIALWERFELRDYGRFDFRCDVGRGDGFDQLGGTIKLLEVNPNPGWCWDGKLSYMAKSQGLEYKDLIKMILQASQKRLCKD